MDPITRWEPAGEAAAPATAAEATRAMAVEQLARKRTERFDALRDARQLLGRLDDDPDVDDLLVVADWLVDGVAELALRFAEHRSRTYDHPDRTAADPITTESLPGEVDNPHGEIDSRFRHHPITSPADVQRHAFIRELVRSTVHRLVDFVPAGPEREQMITAFDQGLMWANAAVARARPCEDDA